MAHFDRFVNKLFGIKIGPEKMRERSAGAHSVKAKHLADVIEWAIEGAADNGSYEYEETLRLGLHEPYALPCIAELKARGYTVKQSANGYVISWREQ